MGLVAKVEWRGYDRTNKERGIIKVVIGTKGDHSRGRLQKVLVLVLVLMGKGDQ